jgi:hypothetical protein
LNPRQPESQSGALPTELQPPQHTLVGVGRIIHKVLNVVKQKSEKTSKKIKTAYFVAFLHKKQAG